ncbi:Laccase [Cryptotermes secundus]|uniref:Laccase n=1 Tax=Cryptotermes secundus TaxID=105785 RepID=A0A2J7PQ17_9NEOP|nr:laccase-1 isoform X2 [Cryptotermes secundus]PNF18421.1 Laccase [Cryptotermes secundus]
MTFWHLFLSFKVAVRSGAARMFLCVLFACAVGVTSASTPVDLKAYLQPVNDIDRDTYLHPKEGSNICARECVLGEEPKICYYEWTVENYATISDACGGCPDNVTDCFNDQCVTADGYERGILTINRRIPAPSIEVCLGDRIIIDIINNMPGRTISIHWHGIFQQGSQFMDGVPMVTQCSIYESTTFRYDFYANNEGTHFYHSHDGLEKLDGLEGNLVVRTPKEYDPNGNLYDFDLPEHKIFISDWMRLPADEHFPGLRGVKSGQDANSFLINGRGRTRIGTKSTTTPYGQINVKAGNRYRLRVVGGLCTVCPVKLTIDGHTLLVIATDGNPVAPVRVDSINLFSGERYDVVLETNNAGGPYWILVQGLATCVDQRVYQLGVLAYEGTASGQRSLPEDPGYDGFPLPKNYRILNPENASCNYGSGGICATQLVNPNPVPKDILKELPDINYVLTFGFQGLDTEALFNSYDRFIVSPLGDTLSSTVNNISFIAPPAPPLTQPDDVPADVYCPTDSDGLVRCPEGKSYCLCVHVIKIPLGSVVQLLLSDKSPRSDLNHPFHLHGYAFYVMEMGVYSEDFTEEALIEDLGKRVRATSSAPILKDTLAIPSGGYAVIKFKANNPGYWFLHCHFLYHVTSGMAVTLHVGEHSDVPTPPAGFPKCGSFTPKVYKD